MAWITQDPWHLINGSYRVSVAYVQGSPRFAAWPPKPPFSKEAPWQEQVHNALLYTDDIEEAKRCCVRHAAMTAFCSYLCRLSSRRATTARCSG